jgi:hypothetical protein
VGAGRRPARRRAGRRREWRRAVGFGIAHRSARPPPRGAPAGAAGPHARFGGAGSHAHVGEAGSQPAHSRAARSQPAPDGAAGSHADSGRPGPPPAGPSHGPDRHLAAGGRRVPGLATRPALVRGGAAPGGARYGARHRPGRGQS